MSTEEQFFQARAGGQRRVAQYATITMVAGAQQDVNLSNAIPPGSSVQSMRYATPANFTGAPTNINLSLGNAAGGAQYVAATDIKSAAAWTTLTFATSNIPDLISWPAGNTLFMRLTAVGGTNPAGSVTIVVDYTPPAA